MLSAPRSGAAGIDTFEDWEDEVAGLGCSRKPDGQGMVLDGAAWCGDRLGMMALRGVADVVRRKPVSLLEFCMF